MSSVFRRVVTGHDSAGKAIVDSDGPAPVTHTSPNRPGFRVVEVWSTDETPARLNVKGEPTDRKMRIEPPQGGSVFRIAEFPPDESFIHNIDRDQVKAAYHDIGSPTASVDTAEPRHPFMHRTESMDYAIVISGEMHLMLDDSEVHLKPGDVVVQRGTNHAWSNRGKVPCVMAFVLIDGRCEE